MSKRVFIIHGWGGDPQEGWFPWLKTELEQKEYEVHIPAMPGTNDPKKDAWLQTITDAIGIPDEETYLVGHSLGGMTILLYLQSLPENVRIGGAVFVAPVAGEETMTERIDQEEGTRAILHPWIAKPIDWMSVRNHGKNFAAVFSDNDRWIRTETEKIFQEKLGAKTVMLQGMKHFSGDDGVTELPEVLESIVTMSV